MNFDFSYLLNHKHFFLSTLLTHTLAQAHIIFTLVTTTVWSLASLPSVSWTDLSRGLLRIPQWLPIPFNQPTDRWIFITGLLFAKTWLHTSSLNSKPERHIPALAALTGESDKWTVTILSVTGGRGAFWARFGHQERLWESRCLGWDLKGE